MNPHASAHIAKQRLKQNKHISENLTVEVIRDQLADADTNTRLKLIRILDDLSTDAALDTLLGLLTDEDQDVLQAVRVILLRPHPRYTQILHRAALEGDTERRTSALKIIAVDRSAHHVPALARCLDEDQPTAIQDMAAQILQAVQTPEAIEIVTRWRGRRFDSQAEAHHTKHAQHDPAAQSALAIIASHQHQHQIVNHRQSFASLLRHVRSGKWGDEQDAARAIHRLVRTICGDPSADYRAIRQDFIDALNDPEHLVRWVVVEALARLDDPEVVPPLLTCLYDPAWTIRVAAIRALIEIGDVAVVSSVAQMINDPNPTVQEAAVEAVGRLGSPQNALLLAAIADSKRPEMVRVTAIEAIARLRGTQAVPALLRLLDDPDPLIRWHTAVTLSELADETSVTALIQHLNDNTRPRWEEKRVCDWLIDGLRRINTPVASVAVKRWQQAST